MKKLFLFFVFVTVLFFCPFSVQAKQMVPIYFFHGAECPNCIQMDAYLETVVAQYDNVKVYRYEVWHHPENSKLLEQAAELLNVKIRGVPFTVVGNQVFQGYGTTIPSRVERAITQLSESSYNDRVGKLLGMIEGDPYEGWTKLEPEESDPAPVETPETKDEVFENTVELPLLGEISVTNLLVFGGGFFIVVIMTILYFFTGKKKSTSKEKK